MQNLVVVFTFSVLDWKHPFWANLVQKVKIVSLSWKLVLFGLETPFLGKFGTKNQNCQFKLKFGTKTNSNMQNSMALFTFSVLDRKHPFLD